MPDNDSLKDKGLDDLLDRSLAEYSSVEPRAGLENRILAGLASRDERASKLQWNWKWVGAFAAACLVVALLIASREQRPKPTIAQKPRANTEPRNSQPSVVASIPRFATVSPVRGKARRSHKSSLPVAKLPEPVIAVAKQPVFPAPSPLSEQEKLLFAYLRRTPMNALRTLAEPPDPQADHDEGQERRNYLLPQSPTSRTNSDANAGR